MGSPIKMNIKNPGPMAEYEGRHRNNVIWRADKMSKYFFVTCNLCLDFIMQINCSAEADLL